MRTLLAITIVIVGGITSQVIVAITNANTAATLAISVGCLIAFTAAALLAAAPAGSTRALRRTSVGR